MSKGSKFLISFFISLILSLLFVFSVISWAENDDITAEEITEHIRYLASDQLEGRKAGTEGCEKAAEYVATNFKEAGLKPLGDDGTYFQNFSFTSGVKLGGYNSMTFDIGERKLDLQVGKDFLPISFSSDGKLRGELVFAGYGISSKQLNYDDYAGIDVKDKIVLVLRYTPEGNNRKSPFYKYASLRYKAINARENGAKGVIFTTPLSQKEEEGLGGIRFDRSFTDSGVHAIILRREIAQEVLKTVGKDMKTLEQKLGDKKPSSFIIPETEAQI
ncbi:MAG TPA: PA domain-containing protein, partial [Thermodesulfobacteriota bacterium]|nr:PA domain-containing protein [Thermodesulfobacteriota bacterium]